jgi:nicotinate-nucleotide adenylyltransferase
MSIARRVGLFGGSFDPVHNAHLALARSAVAALALDELLWIPAGAPWQKARVLAPAAQRAEMVRLAIAGEPRFRLEACELERSGASYTIDTVLELQQREPAAKWFLVLGQDQLARLHTWHRWRELVERVTLAVANRAGEAPRIPGELAVSHLALAEVPLPPMPISSTEIRERLAAGLDLAALVPAPVAGYIETHGLYRHPIRS